MKQEVYQAKEVETRKYKDLGCVPLVKIQIRISNPKMTFCSFGQIQKSDFESIEPTLRKD